MEGGWPLGPLPPLLGSLHLLLGWGGRSSGCPWRRWVSRGCQPELGPGPRRTKCHPHCRKEKPQDQEGSDLPEGTWVWTPGIVASLKNGGSQGSQAADFPVGCRNQDLPDKAAVGLDLKERLRSERRAP